MIVIVVACRQRGCQPGGGLGGGLGGVPMQYSGSPTATTAQVSATRQAASPAGTEACTTRLLTHAGASFPAGTIRAIPWPATNERYNRVKFTLGGTSPTFTVDAFLTNQEPMNWKSMPDGI